ncbi:MAG TPA: hypothetical protein VNM24_17425 [Burkholderiales bacterium]|jgi:hypothetical protein|nr:hypothetical protein [Burkholderiales bacterium]
MALRFPIDVAAHVSPELSAAIEAVLEDPDREQPPTLEDVRASLQQESKRWSREGWALHPEERSSVIAELDALIDQFGEEALAIDFAGASASEALSRVIEAATNDPGQPDEPTLGTVRAAILNGLAARLIGNGVLDADEDATLLDEIDALIRRHGEDAVAETFIRLE